MRRLILTVACCGLPALGWADTRRFALIAGANDGGGAREGLRYAVTDAEEFGDVLEQLGGVPRANQTLLIEPNPAVLEEAINNLAETVGSAEALGMRTEVVVYYSGHSDETGLLLGEEVYPYADLRADLETISADVRVVVLDSCASGALVRTKGGVRRPAFLEDQSVDVTGTAYLMSSSADESAQESDRIGGSYFTHYLLTGLRGGADMSQDGRVTLGEAYAYAKTETLKRTESSSIGAQHAEHYTHLKGKGDFVFTDLTATSSSLVLDEAIAGHIFIRDNRENLVAELDKELDRTIELALRPGTYSVMRQSGENRAEAVFEIKASENLMVGDLTFEAVEAEVTRARGGSEMVALPEVTPLPPAKPMTLQTGLGIARAVSAKTQIGLVGTSANTVGFQWAGGFNRADEVSGAQLSTFTNSAGALSGAQLSIGANIARAASVGWQQAMFVNLALAEFSGAQVALINVGEEVKGAQVGLVNRATAARGLQLGLVNAGGDGNGLQLGLVNVAGDYRGASVGIVTVHKKGYNHVFFNAGTIDPAGVSATWGSKYIYTNVMLSGFRVALAPSVAVGPGLHIPFQRFYVDVDTNVGYRGGKTEAFNEGFLRFRLQPGIALGKKRRTGLQTGLVIESNEFAFNQESISLAWTAGLRL